MGMLDGKVAIITGAGRGIGSEMAKVFAKEGASVVVNDIDPNPAQETVAEIEKAGGKAIASIQNISKTEGAEALMKDCIDNFGKLDILVNNAGTTRDAVIQNMNDEQWYFILDTCLKTAFNCIRAATPYMREVAKKEQAEGKVYHRKIINLTSIAGLAGNAGQANYSSAKAGIVGLTKTMAREWSRFKINVNAIAPGFIETRLTLPKETADSPVGLPPGAAAAVAMAIPLGRTGKPIDIANAALFLASDLSNYVTGQILEVNGGMHM